MKRSVDVLRGGWQSGKEWFHFCLEADAGPILINFLLEQRAGMTQGVVTAMLLAPGGGGGRTARAQPTRRTSTSAVSRPSASRSPTRSRTPQAPKGAHRSTAEPSAS